MATIDSNSGMGADLLVEAKMCVLTKVYENIGDPLKISGLLLNRPAPEADLVFGTGTRALSGARFEVAWDPISLKPPPLKRRKLMEQRLKKGSCGDDLHDVRDEWDLNDLLHPAQAFEHPSHVVNDPDLTLNEKRAILASWASDACSFEAAPHLRCPPGGKRPVLFDDVMEALRTLDKQASERRDDSARYRRVVRKSRLHYRPPRPYRERHSIN
jgi:hypothetical protein